MTATARIIFAGTPEFAVPPLKAVIDSPHETVAVLTQPDRPAGRGRKLVAGPVKQCALDAGLHIHQPLTLKDPAVQAELNALQPDLMIVVAYGLLLPPEVLTIPRLGCINIHASLLPRWRGASPIQAAILAGDHESGISIMQMDAGLDTGPVLSKQSIPLDGHETAAGLHDRLAALGGAMLAGNLAAILAGELQAAPQAEVGVSYAGRIKKQDGLIDWHDTATEIDRQIRAYNPWPVAYTLFDEQLLRCWTSKVVAENLSATAAAEPPGTLLGMSDAGLMVQTGEGVVALTEVQQAGRKRITADDFAHSHTLADVVLG